MISLSELSDKGPDSRNRWNDCRFLTCSVLPVRMACNLHCPFCFSKSSISALRFEQVDWNSTLLERYFEYSKDRGANRLVITGGGEPLLKPEQVISIVEQGSRHFSEIACFTNGSRLTSAITKSLKDAGLSYFCWSRHHDDDQKCAQLMGADIPRIEEFLNNAGSIPVRATCVMTKGWIDSAESVSNYIDALSNYGIVEFTFKHTYTAYGHSMFASSKANQWSRTHQVEFDPFHHQGKVIAQLPWGPEIRKNRKSPSLLLL